MSNPIPAVEWDSLPPRLKSLLGPRVERLGYLGSFFKHTAHVPDVLASFIEMTDALAVILPPRLHQTATLTVTTVLDADYERNQQERASVRLGLAPAWICEVQRCSPSESALAEDERIIQRFVLAIIKHRGVGVVTERDRVIEFLGAEQALAVMLLVGRFYMHIIVVNALALLPPASSIFDDQLTLGRSIDCC